MFVSGLTRIAFCFALVRAVDKRCISRFSSCSVGCLGSGRQKKAFFTVFKVMGKRSVENCFFVSILGFLARWKD